MADVATLGIRVDSSGAAKAVSDLDNLADGAMRAEAASGKLGQGSRMMAMQLSQVAQQASATGNFVQALAIQLPDMAMGFGAAGIAGGILASVALPAVASALAGTNEKVQAFTDSLDAAYGAVNRLNDLSKTYSTDGVQSLIGKYGELNAALLEHIQRLREVTISEELQRNADLIRSIRAETTGGWITSDVDDVRNAFQTTNDQAGYLLTLMGDIEKARTFQDQTAAIIEAREAVGGMLKGMRDVSPEAQAVYNKLVQAEDAARQLSAAAPKADWMSAALDGVSVLGQSIRDRIAEVLRLKGEADVKNSMTTGSADWTKNSLGFTLPGNELLGLPKAYANPAKPSVGGGADPFQARLDALRQSLQTEAQIETTAYTQQQDTLRQALEQRCVTQTEYHTMMEQAAQEHQDRMAAIDVYRYGNTLQQTSAFLGDMAGALAGGNSKMLEISKKFGAAQALVNTFTGATEALKLPFPQSLAAFAKVVATGMSAVSAIQGGGGGGKVRSLSGIAAAQGAGDAKQPTAEYIIRGIRKDEFYSGEMLSQIFDGIADEAKKRGGVSFRFT